MFLDPSHPQARLQRMLAGVDTVIGPIICSSSQTEMSLRLSENVIAVYRDGLARLPMPSAPLPADVKPENMAIIQHTSGSTGFRKAIVVTHIFYFSGARAHGVKLNIESRTRVYQFASYGFDACLGEILTGLMRGAYTCVPRDSDRMDMLAESITAFRATWVLLTPSTLRLLHPSQVTTLETLVTGGERVDRTLFKTWVSQVKLIEAWGPAETAVYASTALVKSSGQDPSNISFPLGCRIWVVEPDRPDRLAPIGCTGELIVEGPAVEGGYLNGPDKPDSAFIKAPAWLRGNSHGRVYKTGDLGRYSLDGSLIFIGRKDTQIKHHGQRAELADVERNLGAHPNIAGCLVLYPAQGPYAEQIVVVVEYQGTASRSAFTPPEFSKLIASAKGFALKRLASYMIPTAWLFTPRMPLDWSSKMDRSRLLMDVEALVNRLDD